MEILRTANIGSNFSGSYIKKRVVNSNPNDFENPPEYNPDQF